MRPPCREHTSSCPGGLSAPKFTICIPPLMTSSHSATRRSGRRPSTTLRAGGKRDGDGIREFRGIISSSKRSSAVYILLSRHSNVSEQEKQEYGRFFMNSAALLGPWLAKLEILTANWSVLMGRARELDDTGRKKHLAENSFAYGYRGVAEYFGLIHKHRASLEEAV